MNIQGCSHLHGGTILEHDFPGEHIDLLDVLSEIDVPLRAADEFTTNTRPLRPKRQARTFLGVRKPALMPADLPTLNGELDHALDAKGWDSQPIASTSAMGGEAELLGLKGDFVKNKVFVEVEFGNVASLFRDLFKFQIANRSGLGDVGVLIVATDRLARFHDQGVATYEAAQRLLPYLAIGIQMPIWIVGIEPTEWSGLRARYEEMWQRCADNGVDCHRFDAVYGVPETIADEPEDGASQDDEGQEGLFPTS